MKFDKINVKAFSKKCALTLIIFGVSGCMSMHEENINKDKISYRNLVNNYRIVEFINPEKSNIHIVKKKCIDEKEAIYGYYDILYDDCIVKVDEDDGYILNNKILSEIHEHTVDYYLNKYGINMQYFSNDDLGIIIEWIRNDYEKEKVLVK